MKKNYNKPTIKVSIIKPSSFICASVTFADDTTETMSSKGANLDFSDDDDTNTGFFQFMGR